MRFLFVRLFIFALCLPGFAGLAAAAPLTRLWDFQTTSALPQSLVADRNGRPYLYLAQKEGGLVVLDLSQPGGPKPVADVPIRTLGGLHAMNLVQEGDRLFLALGDLFAAGGSKAGLAIIDISQPTQPRLLSLWTSATALKGSAVVLVSGRYAYLGAMREGVFIFDVSDPRIIVPVSTIQPDVNFPRPNPNSMQHPNARGLAIEGNLLFVAYDLVAFASSTSPTRRSRAKSPATSMRRSRTSSRPTTTSSSRAASPMPPSTIAASKFSMSAIRAPSGRSAGGTRGIARP